MFNDLKRYPASILDKKELSEGHKFSENDVCGIKELLQFNEANECCAKTHKNDIEFSSVSFLCDETNSKNGFLISKKTVA